MAGNVPFPANDWTAARRTMAGAFKWPRELAVHDLRYWADPKACEGRKRPSYGALGEAWGVSKSTVKTWVDAFEHRTPTERTPNGNRTDTEQTLHDDPPAKLDNDAATERSPNAHRTAIERQPNAHRTALIETRAVPSPSPSPSPSPNNMSPQAATLAEQLNEARAEYRKRWRKKPARSSTIQPKRCKAAPKTNGEALWKLCQDPQQAQQAIDVLAWLSVSDNRDAETYRNDGRDLVTVFRHLDRLHETSLDFPAGQVAASGDDTAAALWSTALAATKAGKLHIAAREDSRLRAAVEAVGGLDALRRCPPDRLGFVQRQFENAVRGGA